ncbi:uncharacterized protein [Nicotiana sylvestris]|uniref:uncharacterized protein n=1 Tax=Nicotiana sylvestris TaxID=4096 RepID=UPI00388C6836
MEVYIYDMLVKSAQAGDHIQHLLDTFQILRKFNMKLNPEKCAFGVSSLLKKQNRFEWIEECQQAHKNLKAYLSNPLLLAKLKDGERLLIYLAVSEIAVSVVLVRENKGKPPPIYYVSKSLLDAETRYPHLEKLDLALVMASRKLRPYFLCHPISVVTAYPLRNILHKQELSGFSIFVADFSPGIVPEAEKELQVFTGSNPGSWTLFNDGSSNCKGVGLGIVLLSPSGETIRQGTYIAREARMQQYLEKTRELIKQFQSWKIVQIPKEENAEAEALANLASVAEVTNEENATVIHLFHSALHQDKNEVNFNNLDWDWRNEFVNFFQYRSLHEDKQKAQSLQRKAACYCLVCGNLYRKMFGGPLTRCLGPSKIEYVMREVHERHCGNHAGGRSLKKTLIRAGYCWPKMEEDAKSFAAKCDKCQ